MTECWQEGDLRAYYDGELTPAEMARAAAHLSECPECEALADEVAGRAARVAGLMAALPEPEQVMWMPRRATAPAARRVARTVWAAALAVAAGIAVAVWIAPRSVAPPSPPVRTAEAPPAPIAAPVAEPEVEPLPEPEPAPVMRRRVPRPRPQQMFLALDDEPIETGYVVRVALGAAEIPADVIIGADGRARAIRLVSNTSYK